MGKYTSLKIGGIADVLVFPGDDEDLRLIRRICGEECIPIHFLGYGTNILFRESVPGIVATLRKAFKDITVTDEEIVAGAGAGLIEIVKRAAAHSLEGIEFAVSIPGSLGGAIMMNAGAEGGEMKDTIRSVKVMKDNGTVKEYERDEIEFSYRKGDFPKGDIILEASIRLKRGEKGKIQERMEKNQERSEKTQPLRARSAGSVCKNPAGDSAGRLIEKAGLKGKRIGGVAVSTLHANFIVHDGKGTPHDMEKLIDLIKERVHDTSGVILEEEIKIIGEPEEREQGR